MVKNLFQLLFTLNNDLKFYTMGIKQSWALAVIFNFLVSNEKCHFSIFY